jgi:hypothetical protein
MRMNAISSAEFRRTYAKLTEPTIVTVNGHPIGTWTPGFDHADLPRPVLDQMLSAFTPDAPAVATERPPAVTDYVEAILPAERFNTQPFRGPIPKSGKRPS